MIDRFHGCPRNHSGFEEGRLLGLPRTLRGDQIFDTESESENTREH